MTANLIFTFLIFFSTASAAYQIGVLECDKRVQLIDYFEGSRFSGIKYSPDLTFSDLLETIKISSPDRVRPFQTHHDTFQKIVEFIEKAPPPSFPPEETVLEPPLGCRYLVVATWNMESNLKVQRNLWERLSSTDQAGVTLHWAYAKEYSLTHLQPPPHSIYIRNLNSLVPHGHLAKLPFLDFANKLRAAGFTSVQKGGVLIDLNQKFLVNGDLLSSAYPVAGSTWNVGSVPVKLAKDEVNFHVNGAVASLRFEGEVPVKTVGGEVWISTPELLTERWTFSRWPRAYFYPSGQLRRAVTTRSTQFKTALMDVKLSVPNTLVEEHAYSMLIFYSSGVVDTLTGIKGKILFNQKWIRVVQQLSMFQDEVFSHFYNRDPVLVSVQGQILRLRDLVEISVQGIVRTTVLDQNAQLRAQDGTTRLVKAGTMTFFDESGNYLAP